MTQTARPISDVDAGSWTTVPLYSKINDVSDDTYITGGKTSTECIEKLANLTDPASSSNHTIYVRAKVGVGSSTPETLAFYLRQGAAYIGWSSSTISRTTITTYSYTLTADEANAITDYTDLRLSFMQSGLQTGETILVYDVWMECPGIDAAPAISSPVAATVVIPAPTITATTPAPPSTVAATVAVPAPTVTGDSSLEATTVAATAAIPEPDIPLQESPTVYPDTVAVTVGIGDNWSAVATGTTGGPGDVGASTVPAIIAIPAPTVTVDVEVSPDTVAAVTAIPAPAPAAAGNLTVTTVAAIASVPTPTVTVIDPDAVITPTTVAAVASVPAVTIGGDAVNVTHAIALPNAVAATAAVPAPTVTATVSATATPDTVAAVAAVPTALVSTTRIRLHRHYRRRPLSTGGYALEVEYQ
jgi:hypothetical protein